MTESAFEKDFFEFGFKWESQGKAATALSRLNTLSFGGLRVLEASARFKKGTLEQIELLIYSRGDAGTVSEKTFNNLINKLKASLSGWSDSAGVPVEMERIQVGAVLKRMIWIKEDTQVVLDWSVTLKSVTNGQTVPFQAEFIKIVFSAFDFSRQTFLLPNAPARRRRHKTITLFDLKKNITRSPAGDITITGIPMVNQGAKSYCIDATIERVLRYFGRDFDQHEIAQLASSSPEEGTLVVEMLTALRRMARRLDIRVDILYDMEDRHYRRVIDEYNRIAKRLDRPAVNLENTYNVISIYSTMDYDILKSARQKSVGEKNRFIEIITRHIEAGVPVTWLMATGMAPENPPLDGVFGHMRLITGLNKLTEEIIYSDSWGAEQSAKRMSFDDAWAVTLGIYAILPRTIRP